MDQVLCRRFVLREGLREEVVLLSTVLLNASPAGVGAGDLSPHEGCTRPTILAVVRRRRKSNGADED